MDPIGIIAMLVVGVIAGWAGGAKGSCMGSARAMGGGAGL